MAAGMGALPGRLDAFIHSNSAVWLLGCVAMLIVSVRLLWDAGHRQTEWEPTRNGVRFDSVVVYSRPDCLLCEEAIEILSHYRRWLPPVSEVSIEDDPELRKQFDEIVPVVEIDGKIRFRGSVNEVLLRRLIEGTSPLPRLKHR